MADAAPTRLARRLGTGDAVVVGLGAMLGAGVFAAFAPAARVAGSALLVGLAVAAAIAYCNATSSARLAARFPESGGAYVYGGRCLGPRWGFLAGWSFIAGKLASCAAMALTFATYAAPGPALVRPVAAIAVLAATALDYRGIHKTALATRAIVVAVLLALAVSIAAIWGGGATATARLWPLDEVSAHGVLAAAGYLFFAFAGYARLATLGEEVRDPARTIPRAISIALAIALAVYTAVAISVLAGLDAEALATAPAPIADAVAAGRLAVLAPVTRIGAAVAAFGALLSLVAGIGRTVFAMAANGDLPRALAAVHPRYHVPHRAELAIGGLVAATVAVVDLREAIGFSSCCVLAYYAIGHAAAFTLGGTRGRAIALLGIAGCVAIAIALPATTLAIGAGVLATGALVRLVA